VVVALPPLLNFGYKYYLPVGDESSWEGDLAQLGISDGSSGQIKTPFSPLLPTITPFRPAQFEFPQYAEALIQAPAAPTAAPTALPPAAPVVMAKPVSGVSLPPQVSSGSDFEEGNFFGIDFVDRKNKVTIKIFPANKRVNGGKPITISFIPGRKCEFGDKRACVNLIYTPADGPVTFLSIHSGVGGEAQGFRSAIEGIGLDQALFSLKQVQANLNALSGSEVVINQGDQRIEGLRIVAITRIPAKSLNNYIDSDLNSALEFAASLDDEFEQVLQTNQPQVVFETCGWRMPGEPASRNVSPTSASIYLTVIQKAE
jgi:hypothetical protein